MKLSEISSKDVINDEDGVKLGKIVDAEIDVATGKIVNVTIYRGFKFFNVFGSKDNVLIDIPIVDLQSVNIDDAKKVEDIIQDNSEDSNNMPEDLEATCAITPVVEEQEQPKNKLIF